MLAAVLTRVHSYVLQGIEAVLCEVEVDVTQRGTSKVHLVGLPQAAMKESIERIRRALINSGFPFPSHQVAINLAPADLKKEAAALDLPVAVGILRSIGAINTEKHKQILMAGELALDGRLRKIKGALSLAMLAKLRGFEAVILPAENAREAAVVEGVTIYPCSNLGEVAALLNDQYPIEPFHLNGDAFTASQHATPLDFADVRGQESVKRAVTIACAGAHNILLIGPPGTGKTMLAQRMAGILPPLQPSESLETTRIYSALGLLPEGVALMDARPVRSPHHSATAQALVGGGSIPKPGEVSLAHNGILFLDEFPEFSRHVLEMLRQPLEGGEVTVARVHSSIKFPARFMLVAAMNPTPSGFNDDPRAREKYLGKLSGPLLDRIDIHVEVPAVAYQELTSKRPGTNSESMRSAVLRVRQIQQGRFSSAQTNSQMNSKQLQTFAELDGGSLLLVKQAMSELGLSARAYDKVRRVARTLADLDGSENIGEHHVAEAVQYRLLDRRK